MIGYLDKVTSPLVLIMAKISEYIKAFKVKGGDKDKNNKSMSFHIDDEKQFEKYKAIWTKSEDIKNIELNVLPVYDDRCIKTKVRTYNDKVYIILCGKNKPEDDTNLFDMTWYSHMKNVNLLQSILLILYFYMKTNITCKFIYSIVLIKLQTKNDRLSWWKSFWRFNIINAALWQNWCKWRNLSC